MPIEELQRSDKEGLEKKELKTEDSTLELSPTEQEMSMEERRLEQNVGTLQKELEKIGGVDELQRKIAKYQKDIDDDKDMMDKNLAFANPSAVITLWGSDGAANLATLLFYLTGAPTIFGISAATLNGLNVLKNKYKLGVAKREDKKREQSE